MLERLISLLIYTGQALSPLPEKMPAISRDPKDDYLLAYAVSEKADYLVTGDDGLLTLEAIAGLRIVTPATFLSILETNH